MRILLYIVILTLVLFAPVQRVDIAKLQPVEAVAIWKEGSEIILKTDTEEQGKGVTVEKALENLKENASAIIYLDTARFLLVADEAKVYTQEILQHLKTSIKVGNYSGGDVKQEAKWLDVHSDAAKPQN